MSKELISFAERIMFFWFCQQFCFEISHLFLDKSQASTSSSSEFMMIKDSKLITKMCSCDKFISIIYIFSLESCHRFLKNTFVVYEKKEKKLNVFMCAYFSVVISYKIVSDVSNIWVEGLLDVSELLWED